MEFKSIRNQRQKNIKLQAKTKHVKLKNMKVKLDLKHYISLQN